MTETSDLIYSYKLEGEDDSWSNWTSDTSKVFSDLSYGEHIFHIKSKDEAGNVDLTPAKRFFDVNVIEPGMKKWNFPARGVNDSPAIGSDGTIYVSSFDNNLYALNPDGTEKWHFETGRKVHSSPAFGPNGTIYFGSLDNHLYALNPNGTVKWTFEVSNYFNASPVVGPKGIIYIGSYNNTFYAIKPDGSVKWTFGTKDGVVAGTAPAISDDGTIYVGTTRRSGGVNFYAINPDGTKNGHLILGNRLALPL